MLNEGPVARAVLEALDAVAVPEVRAQILHRALHTAREHQIPGSGDALQRFVGKHLRAATAFYLGNEAAEAVMRTLQPILSLAARLGDDGAAPASRRGDTTRRLGPPKRSGVSKASPREGPPSETDKYPTVRSMGTALPMVLLATRSIERCNAVEAHLEGAAAIQRVEDVVSFLDNLKATASLCPLVVVDCVETSVRPATLATLTHELPRDSAVLLWGATDEHHRDLTGLAERDRGWLRCGVEASPSDVAALIHMLIGE